MKMSTKKNVIIYTDGACKGNPGPGAGAYILLYKHHIYKNSVFVEHTTNNRMEMLAVIKALECLKEPCNVTLYTDSQYIVNAFNKEWVYKWERKQWKRKKSVVKNHELWQTLLKLVRKHKVNFVWIRGHNGNKYNEMCDKIANVTIQNNL